MLKFTRTTLLDSSLVDVDGVLYGAHSEVDSTKLSEAYRLRSDRDGRLEVLNCPLVIFEIDAAHSLIVKHFLERAYIVSLIY